MKDIIVIQYNRNLPNELIDKFKEDLPEFTVFIEKQTDSEWEYATGSFINDIIIYISDNYTSLIVTGLIVRASYDLLKHAILELFKGLKKSPKIKTSDKTKKMSIKCHIGEKTLDFEMETNLNDEIIEKAIDQSFQLLKDHEHEDIIDNMDYLSQEFDFKQVKYLYNPNNNLWEPVNYGEIRKKKQELLNRAYKNLRE
jgi:hypothetical protein